MEEALQPPPAVVQTPEPAPQTGKVVSIAFGHASHDTFTSMLAPLLPLFIANMALSKTEAGLLTSFMQGPALLQPFIGHLSDRRDLRYAFVLAPTCTALAMGLLGLAPSYAILAVLLLLGGVSSAVWHGIGPGLSGRLSGPKNLGRSMAFWVAGGEIGYSVGPLLVVTVVKWLGLKGTPVMSIIGVMGSVLIFTQVRNLPRRDGRQESQTVPLWQALVSMRKVMLPVVGLVVVRSFALSAMGSFLPTFLLEQGTGFWLAGAALTIYQGAASVGGLLGGSLSDRLGRRVVLLASMLITPLLLLVFLSLTDAPRLIILALIGLLVFTFDPVILALLQENHADNRALAGATYLSLLFVVRSVAVVVMGAVADRMGLRWAFAASAIICLLGTPLVFSLPGKQKQRPV